MTNRILVTGVVALMMAGAPNAFAGPPTKCVSPDIPLIVEVLPVNVPCTGDTTKTCNVSALTGDNKQMIAGNSVYVDGERGVYNLRINGCSGSNDATFGLVTSNDRYVLMAFPNKTAGSTGTAPKWVPSSDPFVAKPYMNVRDILWGRRNGLSTFTTQMSIGYIRGPGDTSDYQLRFYSPDAQAPSTSNTGGAKPIELGTALVTVVDTPCAGAGSYDSWTVTIAPSPVLGALYKTKTNAPAGLYDMPMSLRFTSTVACK